MKREIPPVLWISIVVLGVVSVLQLFIALRRGPASLLVGVALNLVLLAGLLHGCRWAYVLTLVLSAVGVAIGLGKGDNVAMGVLVGNALVVIPVVFATRFFFPAPAEHSAEPKPGTEPVVHP
ncbi:MAG: hypothetical protein ABFE13_15785 [Phycisphaerales bacterium]